MNEMASITVVLVEPLHQGNVGAVARSMSNFGLEDLALVNPCPLGDVARRRAKHGRAILEKAQVSTLDQVLGDADISVGTTGIMTTREQSFHRQSVPPGELAKILSQVEGSVAVLFGREDYGLYNEELSRVDFLVHIPCSLEHPVMNLSHAAGIIFWELGRNTRSARGQPRLANGFEKETLFSAFSELLAVSHYPRHRQRRTEVMFRRLMSRAFPTKWEFHALTGVLRGAAKRIRRLSESPATDPSS